MGLFGSNKDDTRSKIEELKAKMQSGQGQVPQGAPQPWQGQQAQQAPPQGWQPPREQQGNPQQQQQTPVPAQEPKKPEPVIEKKPTHQTSGILLELGDGMSLNLPIKEKMQLEEFLRIADRVRELKKIDHS